MVGLVFWQQEVFLCLVAPRHQMKVILVIVMVINVNIAMTMIKLVTAMMISDDDDK